MPLADHAGRIAGAVQDLGQGHFTGRQCDRVGHRAGFGIGIGRQAAAERVAPGQEGSAGRCAKRHRRVELRHPHAFRRHPVEVRGLEPGVTVTAEIAKAEIVGKDDDNVGPRGRGGSIDRACQYASEQANSQQPGQAHHDCDLDEFDSANTLHASSEIAHSLVAVKIVVTTGDHYVRRVIS